MKNFAVGLGLGLVGFVLWHTGVTVLNGGEPSWGKAASLLWNALAVIGFGLMFGGTLLFWILLPLNDHFFRRKSNKEGVVSSMFLLIVGTIFVLMGVLDLLPGRPQTLTHNVITVVAFVAGMWCFWLGSRLLTKRPDSPSAK